MLPLNLLALDITHFDTALKAGQGVQPPETGFSATFGLLMDVPEAAAESVLAFPPVGDALTSGAVPGGETLPQAGNALPPSAPHSLPAMATTGRKTFGIVDSPEAQTSLSIDAPGAAAVEAELSVREIPALGEPALPTLKEPGAAATMALPDPGTVPRGGVPADAPYPGVPGQLRLPEQGIARVRPTADMGPALMHSPGTGATPRQAMPHVTVGSREFSLPAFHAAGAGSAVLPVGTEAVPAPDAQDLKNALPSAAPLPMITAVKGAPAANVTPSPAPPATSSGPFIDVSPGQPGWSEALGDRVTWMAGNRIQNAELRLNPTELGPLRVQISMDDGNATVTFSAQHPLTRDAIEQALPRLREMLADQGLSLQNASVNDQGARHEQAGGESVASRFAFEPGADGGMVEAETPAPAMQKASGLVDVFA